MVRNDPYLVLGVSPSATQAEIAHAYRNRLRAHHPDTRHTMSSREGDEHLRHVLECLRPAS
jgi:DnaJ-class molecular chaperone